jgi:hypothetical protein
MPAVSLCRATVQKVELSSDTSTCQREAKLLSRMSTAISLTDVDCPKSTCCIQRYCAVAWVHVLGSPSLA